MNIALCSFGTKLYDLLASAAMGVMTGAFASHGLKKKQGISNESINNFQTAANFAVNFLTSESFPAFN
jgi:uncharacterized membrane protein YgdD (TMEM256/DUF423 family)